MTDTQWPIFLVFQQLRPDQPHQHAGAVHAPDQEMALLNARDVFVRRPACFSLWVVKATEVLSRTKEEMVRPFSANPGEPHTAPQTYIVFQKLSHSGVSTEAGEVQARSREHALEVARSAAGMSDALVWWVVAKNRIFQSDPDQQASFFEPASDKKFRSQSDFKTLTLLRKLRAKRQNHES